MKHHRNHARFVRVARRQRLTFWKWNAVDMFVLALSVPFWAPLPLVAATEPCIIIALYVSAMRADGKL